MSGSSAATLPLFRRPSERDAPTLTLPEGAELRRDLVYATADGQDWLLDLFLPRDRTYARPAVVCIHGGSDGTRQQVWHHAAALAAHGITGACIQRPNEQMQLPQAAVRWLRGRAPDLGIDPDRVGAAGSSGGSFLAALLGIDDVLEDGISSKVQAVVAMKGKYGTNVPGDTTLGPKGLSPYRRATDATAPTLLIHAREDPITPYAGAVAYQRRLRELGVPCDLLTDPAASHRLDHKSAFYERVLPEMARYFLATLD